MFLKYDEKDVRNIKNKLYVYKDIALFEVPQIQFNKTYNILSAEKTKIHYINVNNYKVNFFISGEKFKKIKSKLNNKIILKECIKDLSLIRLKIDNQGEKINFLKQLYKKVSLKDIFLLNSADLNKVIIICKSNVENNIINKYRK